MSFLFVTLFSNLNVFVRSNGRVGIGSSMLDRFPPQRREGAKKNPLETRQRFAPLREKSYVNA